MHRVLAAAQRSRALTELCQKHYIASLYVFGSRALEVREWVEGARAELVAGPSDVDVGIKAAHDVHYTVGDKVQIALELEDWLGVNQVDLIVLDTANPFLAEEVIKGERLYARDEYQADEYDLYVLRRAGDLASLEREKFALVLERFS